MPLVYLQQPKWIKNDAMWEKIIRAIKLEIESFDTEGLKRDGTDI